jgi:hypothetical protein
MESSEGKYNYKAKLMLGGGEGHGRNIDSKKRAKFLDTSLVAKG